MVEIDKPPHLSPAASANQILFNYQPISLHARSRIGKHDSQKNAEARLKATLIYTILVLVSAPV
jgi:hypothetical protein